MESDYHVSICRKYIPAFLVLFVLFIFSFQAAVAMPIFPGYSWTDKPYWHPTDYTTATNGSSHFTLIFEEASYESDFGLFVVDDYKNPSEIVSKFEIFNYSQEPRLFPTTEQSIYFAQNGDMWQVSKDNLNFTDFDNVFGFYFGIHTGGQLDQDIDYTYYSDPIFNTYNKNVQHIAIAWNGIDNMYIFLDDQRFSADWDWNDMIVKGNDLAPAVTPEPATLILLGSGLIGLGCVGRKKFLKKK